MQLDRIGAIVIRQFYLLRGSYTRIIPLFIWVAVDIVLWGFIATYLNRMMEGDANFIPLFLGAVLLWDFLVRVMQGTSMAFMEDTWSRNFLNLFASPLTIGEYTAGLVLTSILTSLVGLVVMLMLAMLVFGLSFASYGLLIFPFVFVLFLFGIALGVFGCALMLRLGPAAEWFIWPIPALLSPFACVFYPMSVLPEWMQWLAHTLPPAYVFESMRAIVAGRAADPAMLAVGLALAVFYILLACWTFSRVYRKAVKTGLIARYTAESIA